MNKKQHNDYFIFQRFIDQYLPQGFEHINREDPLILEMEEIMRIRKQFFYIGDLINIKIIFTSQGSKELIGLDPDILEPGNLYRATHPKDIERMSLARLRLFKSGTELLQRKEGSMYYSIPFCVIGANGSPLQTLFQGHLFYSRVPYETVFVMFVHTVIEHIKLRKHVYHHYIGTDPSVFRYPDEILLQTGQVFSDREYEILRLLANGLDSEQIAKKLFLSVNTVNTHRRNLLKKTNKSTTHELVIELMGSGLL